MAETPPDNETIVLNQTVNAGAQHRDTAHNALPIGTRMGEFEIIGLIGEGGFGIVYLAQDHSLERKVALKEYMPASLASRGSDAAVVVRSERHHETFAIGLRSFVNEARLLARFDHPALVKVYRFWEANGTAYMAMPYYDGRTLRDVLACLDAPPDEATLKRLLAPVMEALELIHAEQCFHRDIAPDNIMILRDGRPVLLDFGAARRVISDMTQALTVILKPGYAPIEQYAEMPGMKQGPWTDLYALAAVVYYAILHKLPPPSVSRIVQDSYEPLSQLAAGRYSHTFLRGIDACLAVKAEDRPPSVAAMRALIGMAGSNPASPPATPLAQARTTPPTPQAAAIRVDQDEQRPRPSARPQNRLILVLLAAGLTLASAAGWHFTRVRSPLPAAPIVTQSEPEAPTSAPAPLLAAAASEPGALESAPIEQPAPVPTSAATVLETESAPVVPTAAAASSASTRSAIAKSRARSANASGDTERSQAERDYMRQLNRDLDKMLR
ncbi:serine/threonine protein kinase [Uliginosibacterium aquaticum]|nr:serine/threonine-protein kinase [Uliginosibacterium aquaticum]